MLQDKKCLMCKRNLPPFKQKYCSRTCINKAKNVEAKSRYAANKYTKQLLCVSCGSVFRTATNKGFVCSIACKTAVLRARRQAELAAAEAESETRFDTRADRGYILPPARDTIRYDKAPHLAYFLASRDGNFPQAKKWAKEHQQAAA